MATAGLPWPFGGLGLGKIVGIFGSGIDRKGEW